jgi:hypothetical protein
MNNPEAHPTLGVKHWREIYKAKAKHRKLKDRPRQKAGMNQKQKKKNSQWTEHHIAGLNPVAAVPVSYKITYVLII